MRNACFTFVVFVACLLIPCRSVRPLGSPVPDVCSIIKQNCPSHYLCVINENDTENTREGVCICDRFYGFYGEECRKLSFASYLLVVLCCGVMLLSLTTFSYNLVLVYLMFTRNKMNEHVLQVSFFNTLHSLFPLGLCLMYLFAVFEVDKNFWLERHVQPIIYAVGIALYFVASTFVSIYWVQLIEKVRGRENQHIHYKIILYGIGLIIVAVTLFSHFYFHNIGAVGVIGTFFIGYSYHYGGKLVVKSLRRSYLSRTSSEIAAPISHVLELANAVEDTAKMATLYAFLMVVNFIILLFLLPSPVPFYAGQNDLPRWTQGQIPAAILLVISQLMDIQIIKYFHFTLFRGLFKYVPLKRHNIFQVIWNLTVLRDDVVSSPRRSLKMALLALYQGRTQQRSETDDSSVETTSVNNASTTSDMLRSEFEITSEIEVTGVYLVSPQLSPPDIDTTQHVHRARLPPEPSSVPTSPSSLPYQQQTQILPENTPLRPFALVTIDLNSYVTKSRIVVDCRQDGVLEDVDLGTGAGAGGDVNHDTAILLESSNAIDLTVEKTAVGNWQVAQGDDSSDKSRNGNVNNVDKREQDNDRSQSSSSSSSAVAVKTGYQLSAGSHAFIRCYGESFLRCSLKQFEFGHADEGFSYITAALHHHSSSSQVLMAGEIDIDECGVLVRWLNKSGLYMPPRFMIGQAGLPFELAWVCMSNKDVLNMDSSQRQALLDSGSLMKLSKNKDKGAKDLNHRIDNIAKGMNSANGGEYHSSASEYLSLSEVISSDIEALEALEEGYAIHSNHHDHQQGQEEKKEEEAEKGEEEEEEHSESVVKESPTLPLLIDQPSHLPVTSASVEDEHVKLVDEAGVISPSDVLPALSSPQSPGFHLSEIEGEQNNFIWIVKAADDNMWQPRVSTSAYNIAKESVAKFRLLKQHIKKKVEEIRANALSESEKKELLQVRQAMLNRRATAGVNIGDSENEITGGGGGGGGGGKVLNDNDSCHGRLVLSRTQTQSTYETMRLTGEMTSCDGNSTVNSEDTTMFMRRSSEDQHHTPEIAPVVSMLPIRGQAEQFSLITNLDDSPREDAYDNVRKNGALDGSVNSGDSNGGLNGSVNNRADDGDSSVNQVIGSEEERKNQDKSEGEEGEFDVDYKLEFEGLDNGMLDEIKIRAKLRSMKREMVESGVFETHRQGAKERRERKQELGFSRNMKLGQVDDTALLDAAAAAHDIDGGGSGFISGSDVRKTQTSDCSNKVGEKGVTFDI